MLGQVEGSWIQALSADCLAGRAMEALGRVQEIYDRGLDLRQVAMQWVEYLHDLAVLKAAGEAALGEAFDTSQLAAMKNTAAGPDLATFQIAFQTVYRAAEQIFRSDSPKILFDLLVVKLIHGSPFQNTGNLLAGGAEKNGTSGPVAGLAYSAEAAASAAKAGKPLATGNPSNELPGIDRKFIDQALHRHPQIKAVLDHAIATHLDGGLFTVTFETGSVFVEMFQEKRETLAQMLTQQLGSPVQVMVLEQEKIKNGTPTLAMESKIPDDPVVAQAVKILNAKVKEIKRT
jgi:DNA polymerase III gamma/tau subunit